jgi:hypothetical protein
MMMPSDQVGARRARLVHQFASFAGSESGHSGVEAKEHTPARFIVHGRDGDVLDTCVHVAEASLQSAALEQCCAAGGVIHEIDSLCGRLARVCTGEPGHSASLQRY